MKKSKRCDWLIRRITAGLFCATIALCAACSAPRGAEVLATEIEETADVVKTAAEPTAPAPTEPPYRELSEIKIGMVFYGEEGDGSVLTAALREGLLQAADGLGIGEEQILWQYNSREADWTQIEDSILACVDAGCQIVFGGAREYGSVIAAIAEEYPEVMFACVDSDWYNGKNSGTYRISLAAAQYLSGVAAGLADETGHIGFLAAKGASDEEVTNGVNAFAYGVWSVNPHAVVEVGVLGKWFLPEAERQAAAYLQELGCDVIGGYTDCAAGLQAATAAGLRTLGCGAEDTALYGSGYDRLTAGAALYRFDTYFSMKLNQVIQKEAAGEAWEGDYFSGAAEFRSIGEAPQEALLQLMAWRPVAEESESSSQPEETEEAGMWEEPLDGETAAQAGTATETTGEAGTAAGETAAQAGTAAETVPQADAPFEETLPGTGALESAAEATEQEPDGAEGAAGADGETRAEETEMEPETLPVITRDEETGYLTNVRIHEIKLAEETQN